MRLKVIKIQKNMSKSSNGIKKIKLNYSKISKNDKFFVIVDCKYSYR